MEDFKVRYCKLCLTTIQDENYVVVENDTKNLFGVVLSKLSCDDVSKHVICEVCSGKLLAANDFRLTCLYSNNVINSSMDDTTIAPVDLRDIYMKEITNEHVPDDIKICRLCMHPMKIDSECKSISEEQVHMIQKFVPEMNIFTIKEPVICKHCQDSLALHCNFLKQCSDVEQNIGNISNGQVRDAPSPVPSLDISVKIEKVDVEFDEDVPELIKTESLDVNDEEIENESKVYGQEVSSVEKNTNSAKMFKCEECNFKCKLKGNLKKHMVKHKDPAEVKMYKCGICDYLCKRKGFNEHMLVHKDPSEVQWFTCKICGFKTKYKKHIKSHEIVHKDPSELQMYKCEICSFETKYKQDLTGHMLVHKDPSEVPMYKCESCNYETKYRTSIRNHVLIHKDPSEVKMYKCEECDYKTKYKKDLKSHALIHKDSSEVQMYKCDECSYETKRKNKLTRHMLIHKDPSEVQMYKCEKCNYKTKHNSYLKHHMLIHKNPSEIQMYKCEHCNYRSKHKNSLIKHVLKHTNPKGMQTFKCDNCSFETKYKTALKRHNKLIHKDKNGDK